MKHLITIDLNETSYYNTRWFNVARSKVPYQVELYGSMANKLFQLALKHLTQLPKGFSFGAIESPSNVDSFRDTVKPTNNGHGQGPTFCPLQRGLIFLFCRSFYMDCVQKGLSFVWRLSSFGVSFIGDFTEYIRLDIKRSGGTSE